MHWAVRRLILFREQRFDVIVRGVDCTRPSRFVDVLAAQSWNSTPSEDIIGSTNRRCGFCGGCEVDQYVVPKSGDP